MSAKGPPLPFHAVTFANNFMVLLPTPSACYFPITSNASPPPRPPDFSTLYITGSSHAAAKAMVCTTVSASAAGLGVASASLILFQHVGPDQVINGVREREGGDTAA